VQDRSVPVLVPSTRRSETKNGAVADARRHVAAAMLQLQDVLALLEPPSLGWSRNVQRPGRPAYRPGLAVHKLCALRGTRGRIIATACLSDCCWQDELQ